MLKNSLKLHRLFQLSFLYSNIHKLTWFACCKTYFRLMVFVEDNSEQCLFNCIDQNKLLLRVKM